MSERIDMLEERGERGWVAHPHPFGSLDEAWAAAWATHEILGER